MQAASQLSAQDNQLAQVAQRFYYAFGEGNADAMAQCYAPNVRFSDPAFGTLHGPQVSAMWRMLLERGSDIKIEYHVREVNGQIIKVDWVATYPFSQTGRMVVNRISATMRIVDGLIVEHDDVFSLWRWSGQALGPKGWLLGWTPFMRKKINATTAKSLSLYMQKAGKAG